MIAIEVRSPADGRLVGTVPSESAGAVATTVERLRGNQPAWEALGPEGRARWLFRLRDWLADERNRLADVLQSESGKVRAEADVEAPLVAQAITFFGRNAAMFLAEQKIPSFELRDSTKHLATTYRPYPVVGVISPWNFPTLIPGIDSITALLAGAAVLLKPSEVTPLSALELLRGWREIGAPDVFAVVTGSAETGSALVDTVDYVQFTGSTRTGQAIARRCVDRLVPYSLELGGKDAAIVLADADLDRAVRGVAWGALFNAGQACVSVERVYVEAPIYDAFVDRLTAFVGTLRQGSDGAGYAYDLGPMATTAQRDLVLGHIDRAVAAGARALTGGAPSAAGDGFVAPTVLIDVDATMDCIAEESFGPTIPVVKVADADEAIALSNDSKYGLSATVWTADTARGQRLARRLDAGAVNINDAYANLFAMRLPHSGWKSSGIGARLGGADGLRKYTRKTAITAPRIAPLPWEPLWFPYGPRKGRAVRNILWTAVTHGRFPLRAALRGMRRRSGR